LELYLYISLRNVSPLLNLCSMGPYGALHAPKTHLVLPRIVYLAHA